MAIKDALIKKIDQLDRFAKFYQTILIAILTGLGWSVYAIFENKVDKNIFLVDGMGVVVAIYLFWKIRRINSQQDELIEKLKEV